MSSTPDLERLAQTKFGIGQPVRRDEDHAILTGTGQYTDDISRPGEVHLAMLRSQFAHGRIIAIDTAAAKAMPGVLAVYTGADLEAAGYGGLPSKLPLTGRDGSPMKKPRRPALAVDKVRFVGDPIACVVASTRELALDALEAIVADIDPLDAVADARKAVEPGAPQLFADVPGNVVLDYGFGDADAVAAAFGKAHHVTRLRLTNRRIVVNAMEPRAIVAEFDPGSGRFTVHAPTQGVLGSRATLAEIMGLKPDQIRFVAVNVGGSFGMKGAIFPEYVCALHAARALGRPVRWTDVRTDSFLSDHHGRAQDFDCEMALDAQGHILAIRLDGFGEMGAYLTAFGPLLPTLNIAKHIVGPYRTPQIYVRTRLVVTNAVPVTAYRGAGRPEGAYYIERLIETAAAEMGLDAVDLRRRNHIRPEELPWKAPSASVYDSGNFPAILERALLLADWDGYPARKAESAQRGLVRGRGLGQFLEMTAPIMKELGGIRFETDGTVTLLTGTHDHGQGHTTTFKQVVAERLGIPFERMRLMQTDSDRLPAGSGTGGSKSAMSSGAALHEASLRVIESGRAAAAHLLEASTADIAFTAGRFTVVGTDRGLTVLQVAERLRTVGSALPADIPASLDIDFVHEGAPATYPNGCHVCEVEIDPRTGETRIVAYTNVGDFGTLLNPMIVAGQLHGGIVQGLGQVLFEEARYTDEGQLVTGSFMDYTMPRADDVPTLGFDSLPDPARTNPLGIKGCGEAGVAGAMTSVANAVIDALRPYGVTHMEMPMTPEKVWRAIHGKRDEAA